MTTAAAVGAVGVSVVTGGVVTGMSVGLGSVRERICRFRALGFVVRF